MIRRDRPHANALNTRVLHAPLPSPLPSRGEGVVGADLDLLSGRLEAFGADLQVDPRLVHGFECVLEREVAVLEELQLLVQLLQGLLVCQVLVHGSTSSTRAPTRPVARRMRTLRSMAVSAAERMTTPDSASCVML